MTNGALTAKALVIGLKDLRIRVRDRRSAVVLILMPLVLIFILGLVFNPLWRGAAEIQQIPVVIVDHDRGEISRLLIDRVLRSGTIGRLVRVDFADQDATARLLVLRGQRAAGLIIPQGFSQAVLAGTQTRLHLYTDPAQSIRAGIVRSILNRFAAEIVKRQIAITVAAETMIVERVLPIAAVSAAIPKWLKDVEQFVRREAVAIGEERNTGPSFPPAINYYAVGMGVMYLLFGVSMAGQSLLIERREGTLARLRTTPTAAGDIVAGKLLATFLTGFVQFGLLVVFTRVLYRVEWGSPALLGLMVTATSLAAAGLGTFVAALSKSPEAAESLAPAIILPMSFLGGSMWPIYAMPPWMDAASRFTFNRWALDGFLTIMGGAADPGAIARPVAVLVAMAVIFAVIGTRRLRLQ